MNGNRILSNRYELREVVGTGGMAVVYRAIDLKNNCDVAVKVLRRELMEDDEFVKRFDHEANAVSHLKHPNIVNLLDVGQDGDVRYLVMEYVNGSTLKDMIKQRGRIKLKLAISITIKILEAVSHAHAHHIIHRDLKPQNILLDGNGNGIVKVGDFGIARNTNSNTFAQNSGSVLGSVHYFSPEQARGDTATECSDLYSVAVMLYEMVTGQVPFDANTAVSIAMMHLRNTPISPRKLEPSVTKALEEVILKGMAKDPRERYQTADEMINDLRTAVRYPDLSIMHPPDFMMPRTRPVAERIAGKAVVRQTVRWLNFKSKKFWSLCAAAVCMLILLVLAISGVFSSRIATPNFVNMPLTDAVAEVFDMDLTYSVDKRYHDEIPAGVVINQSPSKGTMLEKGDRVLLTVSEGRDLFLMPGVTGIDRAEALRELGDYDMTGVTEVLQVDDAAPGTVIRQEPEADSWVQPSDEVTLYVSGVCAVVPEVSSMTPTQASEAVAAAGLKVCAIVNCAASEVEQGRVITASPSPGTHVLKGGEVVLTVSAGNQ